MPIFFWKIRNTELETLSSTADSSAIYKSFRQSDASRTTTYVWLLWLMTSKTLHFYQV